MYNLTFSQHFKESERELYSLTFALGRFKLLDKLNGLSSFIFVFLNWNTLKGMIFWYSVIRLYKSTAKLLTCLMSDMCFTAFPDWETKSGCKF